MAQWVRPKGGQEGGDGTPGDVGDGNEMTRTTAHMSGGTDGLETGAAEVTVAAPVVPSPRQAEDGADTPLQACPVPAPRAAEPSVDAHAAESSVDAHASRRLISTESRPPWVVVGVVAAILAVTLLSAFVLAHQTMTVHGNVTVHNPWGNPTVGGSCTGAGAYSWLKPGTPVRISSANGKIVGTTALAGGTSRISGGSNYGDYADNCVFSFTLTDVPTNGDSYRVYVGDISADGVTLTGDELRTNGATIFVG
jgi:hypothetical protein